MKHTRERAGARRNAIEETSIMADERTTPDRSFDREASSDDVDEIRYSLTALGEAFVAERVTVRFRGFGPCAVATLKIAG